MTIDYFGDNICFDEMPQGCIISDINNPNLTIVVASKKDAWALIKSLQKMIESLEKHS